MRAVLPVTSAPTRAFCRWSRAAKSWKRSVTPLRRCSPTPNKVYPPCIFRRATSAAGSISVTDKNKQVTHDSCKTQESLAFALGFVLAATGPAVGLGNIWKFPYITGEYGGGAFVLMYLACILTIGIPVMMTEIAIGRCGR